MNISTIAGATRNLGAPPDWYPNGPPCDGLPIKDTQIDGIPVMISEWIPTDEEIALIVAGGPVHLWVCGIVHPPVSIQVGVPVGVPEPGDALAA